MKMLIKCFKAERVLDTDETLMFESKSDPTVVVNYSELEERTNGTQVAQIDVLRSDGSLQRFWIKVKSASKGRVECEVACNDMSKNQSRRKSIFGSWFKPRVSTETPIKG